MTAPFSLPGSPFPGGPFVGKPFSPVAGGGGGGGGPQTDFEGYFVARLSADQTTNLAVGQHIQWDQSATSGIATLVTGAGQAGGLVTINETGDYYVTFSLRMQVATGFMVGELRLDPGTTAVTDVAGQVMRVVGYDEVTTDATEGTGIASICSFSAGNVIKIDLENAQNPRGWDYLYCNLVLLKVG